MSLTEEMVVESLKGMIDPNTGKNLIELSVLSQSKLKMKNQT